MSDYVSPIAIYFFNLSEREKFLENAVMEAVEKYMIQALQYILKEISGYNV